MKIISNFKDYYDYIFGIYYEKGKVFKRYLEAIGKTREEVLEEKLKNKYAYSPCSYDSLGNSFNSCCKNLYFLSGELSFCEKIYPYIIIIDIKKEKYDVFYEFSDELKEIIKAKSECMGRYNSLFSRVGEYFNKNYANNKEEHFKHKTVIINYLDHYIDLPKEIFYKSKELKELYLLSTKTTNTPLRLLKFYNVMSPQKVYQEITMYLSALDNKENNICIIEDKYRIKAKGFDDKSFRKGKGKKRIS
jgi:hypothetical protein